MTCAHDDEGDFVPEDNWTIGPDHPFIAQLRPIVRQQSWNGKWAVRWRDFHAVKQDAEFETEAEARKFARKLMLGPHTTYGDAEMVEQSDQFWRKMELDN